MVLSVSTATPIIAPETAPSAAPAQTSMPFLYVSYAPLTPPTIVPIIVMGRFFCPQTLIAIQKMIVLDQFILQMRPALIFPTNRIILLSIPIAFDFVNLSKQRCNFFGTAEYQNRRIFTYIDTPIRIVSIYRNNYHTPSSNCRRLFCDNESEINIHRRDCAIPILSNYPR